jgi:Mycothiol maleylpyruvate isomerase N-terminal domain
MAIDLELVRDEAETWRELLDTLRKLSPDDLLRPGYFQEGWSAKDALAHIGTWLAEAGVALEQMRGGTYVAPPPEELDELNRRFFEAMKDVPLPDVRTQATAARNRLLAEWQHVPDDASDEAVAWIRKSGPDHYREHLPRLREWASELAKRG